MCINFEHREGYMETVFSRVILRFLRQVDKVRFHTAMRANRSNWREGRLDGRSRLKVVAFAMEIHPTYKNKHIFLLESMALGEKTGERGGFETYKVSIRSNKYMPVPYLWTHTPSTDLA